MLHLLPHIGGGVGSVLRALLEAETGLVAPRFTHSIMTLETVNDVSKTFFQTHGIPWVERVGREDIKTLAAAADLVIVHWWNHPLLMRLLYEGLPPVRLAFWSHVNGFSVPQSFFPELFDVPDLFIFATQASFDSPVVQALPERTQRRLRVIRSCKGIPIGASELQSKEDPFQFGYVGTVEPAKMHPEFLKLCAEANIPTPCIVAGGPAHRELRSQAHEKGLSDRFEIIGPTSNPIPLFKRMHAFAYPLVPTHYGTGEQVLIEAMAFGAVPVVLANPPEQALIRHAETGLIAETTADFTAALRFLADHPEERERMAIAAHRFIIEDCNIRCSLKLFHSVFEELGSRPKRSRRLLLPDIAGVKPGSAFHLFLSSCGGAIECKAAVALATGRQFDGPLPPSFLHPTRGAPAHYLCLLGSDLDLERVCRTCGMLGEGKINRGEP